MDRFVSLFINLFPSEPSTGQIGSIELNIWLAQISGLPMLGLKQETASFKIVITFYGLCVTALMTCCYMGFEIYDAILYWNDLDALTQNTCLSMTHVAGVIKIINTFHRYFDIRKTIEKLKYATRKYVITENQRKAFFRGELENKIFLFLYFMLVSFTCILSMIMLFFYPSFVEGKFPYHFTLPSYFPNYMKFFYSGLSVLMMAMQIVSIDYLNMNLINQIRFQLKILNLSFESLMLDASKRSPRKKRVFNKISERLLSPNERLVSIIQHHCFLKQLRMEVERIYRFPVLFQFFASGLSIALTGFQATVPTESQAKSAVLIYFYCGSIFFELFLYCWFGNDVFEQSNTLSTSGYNSSWYQFDQSFKKSLLIFLSNAQRPFEFTAGGFMGLSLPSFTGILSKSYTYIAVLQRFYGK